MNGDKYTTSKSLELPGGIMVHDKIDSKLYPHQKEAVEFMFKRLTPEYANGPVEHGGTTAYGAR